ncbi:MAG: penicillin-binding protein activator, partial [Pseudomonadota bacterium]|nr:penicillin-binding protein activator [Pseudomonadota bacterium]
MGIDIHGLMLHNIRMRLLIILPLLLSFLSACAPTTTRDDDTQIGAEIREIEENALLLFESGRYSEAATEYLNLSKKNKKRFTFYIVKAIDAYAKEKRYNKASEIVKNNTPDNQDTELNKRIAILNAYDQLESGKPRGALSLLGELSEYEVPENFKIAYHEFLAKANLTHGNYIKAAVEQLKLAKYLVSTDMIDNNTRIVWGIFESISKLELEDLRITAPDELISWFELSLISRTYKYQPKKLENAIDGWAQRYQNHYAHRLITNEL